MHQFLASMIGIMVIFLTISCQRNICVNDNEYSEEIFKHQFIQFLPEKYKNTYHEEKEIGIGANGRLIVKRIRIPNMNDFRAQVTIRLRSAGDPWDKAGSCFIVPVEDPTIVTAIRNGVFPQPSDDLNRKYLAITSYNGYVPAVELMRFMTPFGVGEFSDNEKYPPPIFVDGWAEYVEWNAEVTDILAACGKEVYIGIWIDTWTSQGYSVDARIDYTPDRNRQMKGNTRLLPLLNTVFYSPQQNYPDIFARSAVDIVAELPKNARNIRLVYTATGHGGHSGGDEFTRKKHSISVDGREVYAFTPWRTDCATFRRYNPSSGVWMAKQKMRYYSEKDGKSVTEEVQVPLASSDLSRSNWCPGSSVEPEIIPLDNVRSGIHTFTFAIPEAQAIEGDKMNFWLVSAYLMWEE